MHQIIITAFSSRRLMPFLDGLQQDQMLMLDPDDETTKWLLVICDTALDLIQVSLDHLSGWSLEQSSPQVHPSITVWCGCHTWTSNDCSYL